MLETGTVFVLGELISAVTKIIVESFVSRDLIKLEKVADVLPPNDPLRIEIRKVVEEEKTRDALEDQERRWT